MKHVKVIVVLIIIAMFSCIFIGCDKEKAIEEEEDKGISSGFTYSGGDEPSPGSYLDYKSDVSVFDIDNVRLEVSFGWIADLDYDTEYSNWDAELVIGQAKKNGKEFILYEIPNYNSRDYTCWYEGNGKIGYSHSEEIVIPKEIFEKEGEIVIKIVKATTHGPAIGGGGYNSFKYTKIGDNKIKIREWWK